MKDEIGSILVVSYVGRVSAFFAERPIVFGELSISVDSLLAKGHSADAIKAANIAWTCLTESIPKDAVLARVYASQSPSIPYRSLNV